MTESSRDQLRELVDRGEIPQPGGGRTRERFSALTEASLHSLAVGRLFEAHADARAILDEAGHAGASDLGLLGVWASDRNASVEVRWDGGSWRLHGTKPFCSGAPLLDHALVTAGSDDGVALGLVDLSDPRVTVEPSSWVGAGMRSTETRAVRFDGAPFGPVGSDGWYLSRAGFWHGAVGVAASWFGGALGVLRTLTRDITPDDAHQLALLGEAEALCYAIEAALWRGADEIDARPDDRVAARRRALCIRRVVAAGCLRIVEHAGDALGPRQLAFDGSHSQRVADLEVYVRQEHARHDSEQIGLSVVGPVGSC